MNTLSWLIYFADVSTKLAVLSSILATLVGLVGGILIIIMLVEWLDKNRGKLNDRGFFVWTMISVYVVFELVFLTLAVGLPSKQTLYMIAASEAGEVVVTSPEAQEVMKDLKEVLKIKIKELTK